MNLIVAVDGAWGIGYEGTQPFVIPDDRRFFRETTKGKTVIVGRKTMADFPGGNPLKNRRNIVVSSNPELNIEGAEIAHTVSELFELIGDDEAFVIGGESVYRLLLDYCKNAYVTQIFGTFDADRFFPNLDEMENWHMAEAGEMKEHEGVKYRFVRYENDSPKELTRE